MHLSIKTIVLLVSFFFVTISCFIGGLGLYTTKHAVDVLEKAAMRDLSSQSRLNDLKLRMEVNRSQILQALQHTPGTAFAKMHDHPPAVHLEALRSGGVSLSAAWEEFRQTLGNGAGSHLADVWYERSNGAGIKVVAVSADAIQAAQWDEAARILINEINPLYTQSEPAFQELSALLKMQSEASLVSAHTEVDRNNTLILAAIVCGALLSFGAGLLLVKSIGKPMSEAVAVARRVAEGDLTVSIATNSTNEFGMLLAALSNMQRSLSSVVGRVRVGTDTVAAASKQIASGNLDLSVRTEEQASALEATTGSIEKLSAAVAQNAANAQQANDMAISACAVAERGGAAVAEVTATMRSINDSAGKIVDIIGVIDGIAFQTNILALNAAVEAARAGEQGRGFAVVATEVRNLAQRSAAAAKEIKLLINDSVSKVDSGSRLVDLAGTTMGEIRISIDQVTVIMGEIAAASLEQQLGIEKVSLAITRMDASTLQNAALVEEAAAAAQSLEEQAGILAGVVRTFKIEAPNPGSEKDNAGSASYQRRLPAPKSIGDERQS